MVKKIENIKDVLEETNNLDEKKITIFINDLFKQNNEKKDYSRLINILISAGIEREKILIAISNNIDNILRNYEEKRMWQYNFIQIVNLLFDNIKLEKQQQEIIIEKIRLGYIKNYKKLLEITDYKMDTINMLLEIGLPKKYIIEDRNLIKEKIDGKDYLEFIKYINSNNESFEQEPTIEEFLKKLFSSPNDYPIVKNIPKLAIVLEEQMEIENVNLYDLSIRGAGEYSRVIKVGNYVLKIGCNRENADVPNHPKIVVSFYWTLLKTDIYETFVEIQECIENNWYKNLTEEEIIEKEYKIFKELKDDGISWIDVKKENIGMKNGELMVIDKDHLYTNPNDAMRLPKKYIEFMQKYTKEKKEKIRK